VFVDKDQCTRKSELCWSLLSTLLARCRCRDIGAPKISLVNEVQCGTGTEWRDLIGQHYVADSDPVEDAAHRVKRILDAKYEKADIDKICLAQAELDQEQRNQLAALLRKCEALFDGQLGRRHGQELKLELKEGAKPYHARAYNTPRCHMQTLKAEVELLENHTEHVCIPIEFHRKAS